jgi:hypothetical protein
MVSYRREKNIEIYFRILILPLIVQQHQNPLIWHDHH